MRPLEVEGNKRKKASKRVWKRKETIGVSEPSASGNSTFAPTKNSHFKKQSTTVVAAKNMKSLWQGLDQV